jgi:hypothetical protein
MLDGIIMTAMGGDHVSMQTVRGYDCGYTVTGQRLYENAGSFDGIVNHNLYNCEDIFAILA